jgi:hypothetical protein
MKNLKLEVTEQEVNIILSALQELPHKVSHRLIENLMDQANEQIITDKEIPEFEGTKEVLEKL